MNTAIMFTCIINIRTVQFSQIHIKIWDSLLGWSREVNAQKTMLFLI